jgi:transcriptional regulator with XRE-family HTH domain/mannose-6-phosphate isomerase-like protein (cupin superfamily)
MAVNEQPALGERLRRDRTERGLSLRELARRLDVSASLVSQIETGKINPSVRTLYAIVSELGVSLDDVFGGSPERPNGPTGEPDASPRALGPADGGAVAGSAVGNDNDGSIVQRAGARRAIELETGVRWERLTARNEPGIEFLYLVYPTGGESAPADALVRHSGTEFGVVLKGHLGLTLGFNEYTLGPGDSVFFDSTTPHRLHTEGTEDVEAVWVVLGRQPS